MLLEDETLHAETYALQFSIGLTIICLAFSIYLSIQIRNNLKLLTPIKGIIKPIYIINIALVLRYTILLIDFLIMYYTEGKQSLNDFYQIIIWMMLVNETRKILGNQDLIRIRRLRNPILNQLLNRIKLIIVLILIFSLISSFVISSLIFEIGSFAIFALGVYILYKRFKVEQTVSESKLVKLRWDYYSSAWFLALIFVIVSAIGNGLILILYTNEIDGVFYSIFQLLNNVIPLGISLNFYWFVFIPERGRRSYSLVNPKKFLD